MPVFYSKTLSYAVLRNPSSIEIHRAFGCYRKFAELGKTSSEPYMTGSLGNSEQIDPIKIPPNFTGGISSRIASMTGSRIRSQRDDNRRELATSDPDDRKDVLIFIPIGNLVGV